MESTEFSRLPTITGGVIAMGHGSFVPFGAFPVGCSTAGNLFGVRSRKCEGDCKLQGGSAPPSTNHNAHHDGSKACCKLKWEFRCTACFGSLLLCLHIVCAVKTPDRQEPSALNPTPQCLEDPEVQAFFLSQSRKCQTPSPKPPNSYP